jgi:hypothetical protein
MLFKKLENVLSIFKRKILGRIYGPGKDNGQRMIRYNKEIYELYGEHDLVQRMEGTQIPKKVFKAVWRSKISWKAQEKRGGCRATGSCQIFAL